MSVRNDSPVKPRAVLLREERESLLDPAASAGTQQHGLPLKDVSSVNTQRHDLASGLH